MDQPTQPAADSRTHLSNCFDSYSRLFELHCATIQTLTKSIQSHDNTVDELRAASSPTEREHADEIKFLLDVRDGLARQIRELEGTCFILSKLRLLYQKEM